MKFLGCCRSSSTAESNSIRSRNPKGARMTLIPRELLGSVTMSRNVVVSLPEREWSISRRLRLPTEDDDPIPLIWRSPGLGGMA